MTAIRTAHSVASTMGVQLHTGETRPAWDDDRVIEAVKYLGVGSIRMSLRTNEEAKARFRAMGVQGIFTVGLAPEKLIPFLGDLFDEGRVIALGAINEPNQDHAKGEWEGPTRQNVLDIRRLAPAGIPITAAPLFLRSGYSDLGQTDADWADVHQYPAGRSEELATIARTWPTPDREWTTLLNVVAAARGNTRDPLSATPFVFTESGQTVLDSGPYTQTLIPAAIWGMGVARMFLYHAMIGARLTCHYALLDIGDTVGKHGLFRDDWTPRPAAVTVRNLVAHLKDPAPWFTPVPMDYSLTGDMANVRHMVMAKSDGSYVLALWLQLPLQKQGVAQTIPARALTLSLPSMRTVTAFTPHDGQTVAVSSGKAEVQIQARGHVTLLNIA